MCESCVFGRDVHPFFHQSTKRRCRNNSNLKGSKKQEEFHMIYYITLQKLSGLNKRQDEPEVF